MDRRVDCSSRKLLKDGERGRNRTFNLLIKSQLLCQLSYAPTVRGIIAGQSQIIASACSPANERGKGDAFLEVRVHHGLDSNAASRVAESASNLARRFIFSRDCY